MIDKEIYKEIILALSQALSTNNFDNELSSEESFNNIVRATIKVYCASNIGTGLLLSEDGIFVTAYHVIEPYIQNDTRPLGLARISPIAQIEFNSNKYSVTEILGLNRLTDLAMCYANIPNKSCKAIKFKTMHAMFSYVNQIINIVSIKNGQTYVQYGRITSPPHSIKRSDGTEIVDAIDTDAYAKPGFSGGPVLTQKGELIGLCLYIKGIDELGKAGFGDVANIEISLPTIFQYLGKISKIR